MKKEHLIGISECDCFRRIRLSNLMSYLQDFGVRHAKEQGFGYDVCTKEGVSWVGVYYWLSIDRLPNLDERMSVETWLSGKTAASFIRDFLGKDEQGNVLFRASTQWALMDNIKLRPVAINKHLSVEGHLCDEGGTLLGRDFSRLPSVIRTDIEKSFNVRYHDLDINNHANNVVYPAWASETVPLDWMRDKKIKEVEINFKKPSLFGQKIRVLTQMDGTSTLHSIKAQDDEAACVRFVWSE